MTRTGAKGPRVPSAGVRRRSGLVLRAVQPVAERVAADRKLVVWDLEFSREAGADVLRVAVDRVGGIDADAIAGFAESLSRELDANDAVPGDARYVLEVTSPGAERRLRGRAQFRVCVGRLARVTFKTGREPVEGVIASAGDDRLTMDAAGETIVIPYTEISQARLKVAGGAATDKSGA